MKNIYNISKSQLYLIWFFAGLMILLLLHNMNPTYYCYILDFSSRCKRGYNTFFILSISFVTVFYTIGWKENHKNK